MRFLNLALVQEQRVNHKALQSTPKWNRQGEEEAKDCIGCNGKLVPTQGKEKVAKNVKQQCSSALELSGRSVTTDYWAPWSLSTHIHTPIAETTEAERASGYIWQQKFSKPQNIRVQRAMKLLREHWEHDQLREARVRVCASTLSGSPGKRLWFTSLKGVLGRTSCNTRGNRVGPQSQACWPRPPADPLPCTARAARSAPRHARIFPWKLRADPEGCNPAGDVHPRHGQCANTYY